MNHRVAKFRVLVVDDNQGRLDAIVGRLGPDRPPARSPMTGEPVPFDALQVDSLFTPAAAARRPGDSAAAAGQAQERVAAALRDRLRQNTYHRVYVDFQLDAAGGNRFFGTDLLPEVRRLRPTARRLLVTSQMDSLTPPMIERFPAAFLATAGPPGPAAHGFVPGTANNIVQDVVVHYLKWCRRPIEVRGLMDDDVRIGGDLYSRAFETVREHAARRRWGPSPELDTTPSELWHLVRDLFSPSVTADDADDQPEADQLEDDIVEVRVRAFDSGRSSSTVLECSPRTQRDHRGNTCVVKVGPVGEVGKELARYERYVKFYRTAQRRVEVLGSARGDTLGAICYSFAGGSDAPADALEDLIEARDLRALDCLAQNYSARSREWFKHVLPGESLLSFFEQIHFRDIDEKPTVLLGLLRETLAEKGLAALAGRLPQYADITATDIRYQTCVVHGDMNAGNMMVAELPGAAVSFADDAAVEAWWEDRKASVADEWVWAQSQRPGTAPPASPGGGPARRPSAGMPALPAGPKAILIDYRHTRRGPAFMDFAALECSLRAMPECIGEQRPVEQIATDYERELALWRLAWQDRPYDVCGRAEWRKLGYWGAASYELMKLARRNFEDTQDHADDRAAGRERLPTAEWERQYAGTCILYALRLLKYEDFGDIKIRPNPTAADPRPKRKDENLRIEARVRFAAWLAALNLFVSNPCSATTP